MYRLLSATLFVFFGVSLLCAQSGRRAAPTPKPTPLAVQDDTPQFSESRPQKPRLNRNPDKFPGIGGGSGVRQLPNAGTTADVGTDDEILRVETNLVTIPVSVFDRNGLYIPGLGQENFKIFENGVEQEIAYFGTTDKPFTVVLLIDVSRSTAYKIEEIHQAAIAFVDNLEPQDSVMVIEFAESIHVLTEVTKDRGKIYEAIKKAKFGGGTSLYDAVDFSLRKRLNKIEGRKAIVLFTDGVDTTSFRKYDQTINEAEEADTLIFPIYYNTFMQKFQGGGMPIPRSSGNRGYGDSSEEYTLGKLYLEDLAAATGGRVFRPESTPGGLTAAFEGIAEELRRQYNIGYVPKDEGKPGQRKLIKVRVNRPNLLLRARDSYIVGAATTPVEPAKPTK